MQKKKRFGEETSRQLVIQCLPKVFIVGWPTCTIQQDSNPQSRRPLRATSHSLSTTASTYLPINNFTDSQQGVFLIYRTLFAVYGGAATSTGCLGGRVTCRDENIINYYTPAESQNLPNLYRWNDHAINQSTSRWSLAYRMTTPIQLFRQQEKHSSSMLTYIVLLLFIFHCVTIHKGCAVLLHVYPRNRERVGAAPWQNGLFLCKIWQYHAKQARA